MLQDEICKSVYFCLKGKKKRRRVNLVVLSELLQSENLSTCQVHSTKAVKKLCKVTLTENSEFLDECISLTFNASDEIRALGPVMDGITFLLLFY